jgi:hypothetical protein
MRPRRVARAAREPAMTKTSLALAIVLCASGCLGTNHEISKRNAPADLAGLRPAEDPVLYSWRKIAIGHLPRPTHYGYLKTRSLADHEPGVGDVNKREVRWIYDTDFNLVGSVSPRGDTLRFDRFGNAENLGHLEIDDAIKAIFDVRDNELEVFRELKVRPPKGSAS